jgi:hypothetical protein
LKDRDKRKSFEDLMTARKVLNKAHKNKFTEFTYVEKRLEATRFCREWKKQSEWLRANKVDFKEHENEKAFHMYGKEFGFAEDAKHEYLAKLYQEESDKHV